MLMFRHWKSSVLAIVLASCSWMQLGLLAQQPTELSRTALAIAPRDAAFFMTAIDIRESWREFLAGNFVTRLRRLNYVQSLEQALITQWERPVGQMEQVKSTLENPNVRDLLLLASDMVANEFFMYGDEEWCAAIEQFMEFQNQIISIASEDPEALEEYFNTLDKARVDALHIPNTIIGFRLTDDHLARTQLDALEGILRLFGGQQAELEPFLKKLRRHDFSDGQTLSITLDSSLIPKPDAMDDEYNLEEDQLEESDGEEDDDAVDQDGGDEDLRDERQRAYDKAMELLDGRSLTIALGVKSNLLLIGVGEDAGLLEQVGEAQAKLVDHPRMSVLKEANVAKLRSVSFVSQRWRQSQWRANFGHYFSNLTMQFTMALQDTSEDIPDAQQWKQELIQDAQWLDNKVSEIAPLFGDQLAWSHAIDSGSQGWSYDWSQAMWLENAAPLGILEHAGSDPLLLLGIKQREIPQLLDIVDYLMERVPEHAERFIATAEQDEEDRELALKVFHQGWPLVEEAMEILRDKVAPALDERESLLAFAASWTTQQLGQDMPTASEPLTLPELALACKVSDRELFVDGCQSLYEVFDKVVALVREIDAESIPADYVVPRPLQQQVGQATSYYYDELVSGVEMPGFKPQLMLSDDVLIVGYSDRQVTEMLTARPLMTRPAWLTDQTPVAAVSYADYGGMFAAARPWIVFGLSMSGMPLDEPFTEAPLPVPSGNDLLMMWDCFSAAGIAAGTATVAADDSSPTIARWVWVSR